MGQKLYIKKIKNVNNIIYPVMFFIVLLLIWEGVSRFGAVPRFILPAPTMIIYSLFVNFPSMGLHILITLYETILGFIISIIISVIVSLFMDSIPSIKKILYPLLIASQTIPIIILAPLFIIWFGYGYLPKIIIVILICFFPITISLLQGFATVDNELLDLLRSMNASKLQVYKILKFPSAMPSFFSGLKIAATYSIMGATIGEWVGGKNGLGVYMIRAKYSFATDKVFAAILVITVLSILMLKIINLIENAYMPWLKILKEEYMEE